jgi:tetratricopeptide (TPR) repeat protein
MRKLFQQLTDELKSFLDQAEDLLLLLACGVDDTALVLKTMRDLEQVDASDIFLLHADDFVDLDPFVTVALERLAADYQRTSAALVDLQREPLPPMPNTLQDQARPALARLQEALGFSRSLLPRADGHRLVWVMFPAQIADRETYLQLILRCSAKDGIQPWMRGLRLIFRVPADFDLAGSPLAEVSRLRLRRADFGPSALQASLQEQADDPKLPEAERVNAQLSLATLDYAHGRLPEAVGRYQTVFEFARKTDNPAMQALVLNGLGDIPHRQGNLELAQYWYECAIDPALAAQQPVVLATLVNNLASIAYQKQQFADAAQYYDSLCTIQGWLMNPVGKLQALEGRGLAQVKLGQAEPALASFEEAALLGIGFAVPALAKANLQHMREACQLGGLKQKLVEVETELSKIQG